MKRPPSLQLFDAREEGKGPGMAYGRAMPPTPLTESPRATDDAAPDTPVVATPAADAMATAPKVIG